MPRPNRLYPHNVWPGQFHALPEFGRAGIYKMLGFDWTIEPLLRSLVLDHAKTGIACLTRNRQRNEADEKLAQTAY